MARTERQEKWFASAIASLEKDTGRSLAEWAEVARACPETKHRARLGWFKDVHGLGMNRASIILGQLDGSPHSRHDGDGAAIDSLWADPAARAIYDAVAKQAAALDGTIVGGRKSFTAFSRAFQYAAIRPLRGGGARLGLAVTPDADPRLSPPKNEGWSDRLQSVLPLAGPDDVDASVGDLLRLAWQRSA